jgi:hypothetical protein
MRNAWFRPGLSRRGGAASLKNRGNHEIRIVDEVPLT